MPAIYNGKRILTTVVALYTAIELTIVATHWNYIIQTATTIAHRIAGI